MILKQKSSSAYKLVRYFFTELSILVMALAATIGMVDMRSQTRVRAIFPTQPALSFETVDTGSNNPILREREESGPHYVSYNVSQRTASRHGKK